MRIPPKAHGAVDALSDLSSTFGDQDAILAHLKRNVWAERFALSDSMLFLVSDEPLAAASSAQDLFFAVADLNGAAALPARQA